MKEGALYIVLILFSINSFSQDITKDTIAIKEVTITAKKIRNSDKSIVPLQSIARKELDRISGTNVADAIRNFSGITIKDYGGLGGLKTVMVRSLGANHTGVFMDGVQLSDAATGQVDLGKISTDNAGEISLIIGQSSELCLPARFYSSASVLNISSMVPVFNEKKTIYKISNKFGSFGLINPSISVHNKLGHSFYTGISCNYTKTNGEYPYHLQYGSNSGTTIYRKNSDIESFQTYFTFGGKLKSGSKLTVKSYFYLSERGLPGAVVYYNPFASQRLWNKDFFTNLQYKTIDNKRFIFQTNIKYSQHFLRYLDPEYLNEQGKLDNHYLQHEYYISQALTYKVSDSLQMSLSSDFFISKLSTNLYKYANPIRNSSLTVFVVSFVKKNFEINANILFTLVNEKTLSGESAPSRKKLSPSISMGYRLFRKPNIKIRFLYKDIFRMPTFNDLYYTLVGNNNLNPEFTKQYNLGITGITNFLFIEYFSFKTDIFYNRITDKIVAVPTKNLFVWSMLNVGMVETKGIELQTQIETKKFFSDLSFIISTNYTYQKALDITQKGTTTYQQQIPYIPCETFSATTSINYKKISLNYNILYNGFRYVLGENIYDNMIPSWWVSDVSILYNFDIYKCNIQLKTEVCNIFNKQYEVIRSFPMPGRAFYFSLTLKF